MRGSLVQLPPPQDDNGVVNGPDPDKEEDTGPGYRRGAHVH